MKKTIFKYGLVLFLTVFAVTITDSAYLLLSPGKSSFSIAEAHSNKSKKSTKSKKSKKSDKSEDEDPDHVANCNKYTGICSNRGTVTVKGMKNIIYVSSGSGSVLLDVTSPWVALASKSGDLTARGLTRNSVVWSRIGNVRLKYCKKPQAIGWGRAVVNIAASNSKLDEDGDKLGSDADIQFPTGSEFGISILKHPNKYKSDFTSSRSRFRLGGSVLQGYLFVSEYKLPNPPCKY